MEIYSCWTQIRLYFTEEEESKKNSLAEEVFNRFLKGEEGDYHISLPRATISRAKELFASPPPAHADVAELFNGIMAELEILLHPDLSTFISMVEMESDDAAFAPTPRKKDDFSISYFEKVKTLLE
eukprot:TRINITY_DN3258_c0_g2_i2.p1 TRINITY_DN3258_c0_g2~~TRINITY_DN3258_c0_g2_i2.p1  ORF type:complete len:126 (-),score=15.85 TRINITY_DN3258_c0_g2_i2:9-386(-)